MWLVAHTASGLVASAAWVAARRPHPKQRRHSAIYGLILGAVLPDFDVFGAVALILAGWRASQAIAAAHHVVAHNLPFVHRRDGGCGVRILARQSGDEARVLDRHELAVKARVTSFGHGTKETPTPPE